MTFAFRRLGPSELLPRYVFTEHLYVRRRVLEIGAVAATKGESAKFLLARGARSVLACDDALEAVAEAQRTQATPALRFRSTVFEDLETGTFDVVFVADLAPYVLAPLLFKEIARLVSPFGHLVGGLRNPAGLALAQVSDPEDGEAPPTFGKLLDALQPHFKVVEVATQSPLLGYQLALESGEGLQVDGSLAGHAEAAYFVVLAGQEKPPRTEATWVQLPPAPLAYASGRLEEFAHRAKGWEERHARVKEAWEKARREADTRETALVALRGELEKSREEAARTLAQLEPRERNATAAREGDELTQRVRRLEAELAVARERAEDAERRVTVARSEVEEATRRQQEAGAQTLAAQELARLERAKRDELGTQLDDARERATRAHQIAQEEQDHASQSRLELERLKLREVQAEDALRIKTQELVVARERELQLAESHSNALAAIESLRYAAQEAQQRVEAADAAELRKNAELELAHRAAQGEAAARAELDLRLRDEVREGTLLRSDLESQVRQLSTELAAALDDRQALESRLASDADAHALAQSLEARLVEAREVGAQWEVRANELGAQLEVEHTRAHRLERDGEEQRHAALAAQEGSEQALRQLHDRLAAAETELTAVGASHEADHTQLAGALEAVRAELSTREADLRQAETSLEDARAGREMAERMLSQVRAEAVEHRAGIDASTESSAKLLEELRAREQDLGDWEQRWEGAQTRLRELTEATGRSEAEVAQARRREEVLEEALEAAEAGRVGALQELETLRARTDESVTELGRRTEEAKTLEAERARLTAEHAAVSTSLDEAQSELVALRTKQLVTQASAERFQAESEARAETGREQAEAKVALEGELAGVREALAQLREEHRALGDTQERRQVEADAADGARRELLQIQGRLQAEVEGLKIQQATTEREGQAREQELKRTLETLRLLEGNQDRAKSEWEAKHAESSARLAEGTSKLEEVQGRISAMEMKNRDLTERLQASAALDEERIRLGSELEAVGAARADLQVRNQDLTDRLEAVTVRDAERLRLAAELEQAGAAHTQLEQRIQELTGQVEAGERADQERVRLVAELQLAERERGDIKRQLDSAVERVESVDRERRSLTDQLGRLEAESLRLIAENRREKGALEKAQTELGRLGEREADLNAKLSEKDTKWDVLQRRLTAQETELTALRRSTTRTPGAGGNVQQIYERANAELSAVRAELLNKRPAQTPSTGTPGSGTAPPGTAPKPAEPVKNAPAVVPPAGPKKPT